MIYDITIAICVLFILALVSLLVGCILSVLLKYCVDDTLPYPKDEDEDDFGPYHYTGR